MLIEFFQILVVGFLVVYVREWKNKLKRRHLNWNQMLMTLRVNDWGLEEICERYLWKEGINATPENIWHRISGPKGLWAMYENAGILLQMAEYAAEQNFNMGQDDVDENLLASLRSDAFHLRLHVLMALGEFALTSRGKNTGVNTYRAATLYIGMMARLTKLLQDHATHLLPEFVAAV
jgi:hypothetical protein